MQEGCAAAAMRWIGPWCDAGLPNAVKGGFAVYLSAECQKQTQLTLTIQTERGSRTKQIRCIPAADGRQPRPVRVPIGIRGRRFRLKLESEEDKPWQLVGGLRIEADLDAD